MGRESRTKYAILGMLAVGEHSGYDLRKNFQQRMVHFWSESPGQIYPTLRRLAEGGLVVSKRDTRDGRPDRTVHAITSEGREVLRAWLEAPAAADQVRIEFMLKLFFGAETGWATALRHVDNYEREQSEKLALFESFEEEIENAADSPKQELFWKLTLSAGLHLTRARLAWCRETRSAIRRHAGRPALTTTGAGGRG